MTEPPALLVPHSPLRRFIRNRSVRNHPIAFFHGALFPYLLVVDFDMVLPPAFVKQQNIAAAQVVNNGFLALVRRCHLPSRPFLPRFDFQHGMDCGQTEPGQGQASAAGVRSNQTWTCL
jgi:hypothetical protein